MPVKIVYTGRNLLDSLTLLGLSEGHPCFYSSKYSRSRSVEPEKAASTCSVSSPS